MTTNRARTAEQVRRRSRGCRALASVIGCAVLLAVAAGCSSSQRVDSAATSTSVAATETTPDPPTSDGPPTTDTASESSTTSTSDSPATSTSTTSTTPSADTMVLRADGIGRFALGDESDGVVDGISATLGTPVSDTFADYPVADGLGQYTSAEGETGYVAPMGRSTCWSMGFCAEFGGAARTSMSFTGWAYHDDTAGVLHSTSGVTLHTRLSDAPAIIADQGGCYSVGSGKVDGIRLTLESSGAPFSSFDDSGNYVVGSPSPADVTVIWMETGNVPLFLYGDC